MHLGLPLLLGMIVGCGSLPHASESAVATPKASLDDATPGALLVIGGGRIVPELREAFFQLAGGKDARILIFPQASSRERAGQQHLEAWQEAGGTKLVIADLTKPKEIRRALADANAIWFGGGSQNRLMDALRDAKLIDLIRARHAEGLVVGGTSAGAAVMSKKMLTGDANLEALSPGTTELAEGLGLWPGVIVDQHFHARRRFNRLLSAVNANQAEIGVGIDESTGVVVEGDRWRVVGASGVLIVDSRKATVSNEGAHLHLEGGALHALPAGATWSPSAEAPKEKKRGSSLR